MKKMLSIILKVVAPLCFAAAVLWWMYRGFPWDELMQSLRSDMRWGWMWLSFPFGISAQAFRALRWRQVLTPLGERPRLSTCMHAVFFSYFSSLVVPRSGEVLRCGVLSRYEGVSFSKGVGSVVTERVVDMSMVAAFSLITVLTQLPLFIRFLSETGLSLSGFLRGFTMTGYLVTAVCLILAVGMGILLLRRLDVYSKTRGMISDFRDGLLSVGRVRRPWLFLLYSVGIWVSYYLHFYLAFY
ncbi:MAG: flippase-like domain-containing protein, partial [Bacteroidaceae bacterium]|nr:flippase-like domain-containing protein [Bacteroidaceae bacterium]